MFKINSMRQTEQLFWNPKDKKWRSRSQILGDKDILKEDIIEQNNCSNKFKSENIGMKLRWDKINFISEYGNEEDKKNVNRSIKNEDLEKIINKYI